MIQENARFLPAFSYGEVVERLKAAVCVWTGFRACAGKVLGTLNSLETSKVVREALRLLKERDHAREHLRADVQNGFALARGEGRTYDKVSGRQLAERIKSRGRATRAKKS